MRINGLLSVLMDNRKEWRKRVDMVGRVVESVLTGDLLRRIEALERKLPPSLADFGIDVAGCSACRVTPPGYKCQGCGNVMEFSPEEKRVRERRVKADRTRKTNERKQRERMQAAKKARIGK